MNDFKRGHDAFSSVEIAPDVPLKEAFHKIEMAYRREAYRTACRCYIQEYIEEKGVEYELADATLGVGVTAQGVPIEERVLVLRFVYLPYRLFMEVVKPGLEILGTKI